METLYQNNYIILYATTENLKIINTFISLKLSNGFVETEKIRENGSIVFYYEDKEYKIDFAFDVILSFSITGLGAKIIYTTNLHNLKLHQEIPNKIFDLLDNNDIEKPYINNIINMLKNELKN